MSLLIQIIKRIIQGPFTLLRYFSKSIFINIVCIGKKEGEHTFGYYDKSPWNNNGSRMVVLRIPFSDKMPDTKSSFSSIELLDGNGGYIRDVTDCCIWNTQMANRLQWLGPDFDSRIIFNDYRNNKLVSVIKDLNTDEEILLNIPIYDVSKNGRFAITLNFLRLHIYRPGYGYDIGQKKDDFKNLPADDGIIYLDIIENKEYVIIPLLDLAKREKLDINKMHSVKVNHIMLNKESSRFMFLFRYMIDKQKFTRLYTSSIDGKDLFLFKTNKLVSHANWIDDNTFIVWADVNPKGQRYYIFKDFLEDPVNIAGENILNEDGHPSISLSGKYLLTDTYNDISRRRSLILFDMVTNSKIILGKFYSPFKNSGSLRCDLHPRFNNKGGKICFDAAFKNGRQVYISTL